MYVYIYVYAHARTHAPRARGRRRRRRRRRGIRTGNPTHATHAPRRGSTPNGHPPRGRTRRQIARHASSDDSAHCRASLDRVEKSYARVAASSTHVRWSSSVTSGAPPDVVRTCGTVIFYFFTGERRTRSGACARECAHRTRRRTHATHGGCPPPRVDDVGARD